MKIIILRSSFQTDEFVRNEYADLIQRLENECRADIVIIGDEMVETVYAPSLQTTIPDAFMIATGGVENLFKRIWSAIDVEMICTPHRPKTVTMIADGRNNSLAASLEILTYLGNIGVEGKILHGTNREIISAVMETRLIASLQGRIGLFGQPSDWLIASGVDRDYLRQRYGIETIDIGLQRLIDDIKTVAPTEAEKVAQELEVQLSVLPRENIARPSIENNGKIVIVSSLEEAVECANEIAPEHLEISVDDPFSYLGKIKNAGSIFLGKDAPEALGDYMAGPNHTLPTTGTARFGSPLSVDDFVKKSQYTYFSHRALEEIKDSIMLFAEEEGLHGHANSIDIRFRED